MAGKPRYRHEDMTKAMELAKDVSFCEAARITGVNRRTLSYHMKGTFNTLFAALDQLFYQL